MLLAQFLPWTTPAREHILVAMRTKRKSKPAPPDGPPADDALPPWLPTGDGWQKLPEALRQAVPRVLVPARLAYSPASPVSKAA